MAAPGGICRLRHDAARQDTVMLIGKPGAVLPPPKTYIIATGELGPAGPNVCRATLKMLASKIIHTRRACK